MAVIARRDHLVFDQDVDHDAEGVEDDADPLEFSALSAFCLVALRGRFGLCPLRDVLFDEAAVDALAAVVVFPLAVMLQAHRSPSRTTTQAAQIHV